MSKTELMVVFLLAGCLLAAPAVRAAPSISSVSGTVSHDSSITVSGSGFGSKSTAAPVLWDTVDNQSAYSSLSDGDPIPETTGYPWSNNGSPWANDVEYCTSRPMRGQETAHYHWTVKGFLGWPRAMSTHTSNDNQQLYVNWWWKPSSDPQGPGGSNKMIRVWDRSDGTDTRISWTTMHMTYEGSEAPSWTPWGGNSGQWNHQEIWVDADNNIIKAWTNGNLRHNITNFVKVDNGIGVTIGLVGFDTSDSSLYPSLHLDVADIYIDIAQSRVALGNASTYGNCGHTEIQIPSSWSNNSITATVNRGSLSTGTAYLYVFDSAGNVNSSGYQVTIGGGAPTYSLTVNSGSGDGNYTENTEVNITADTAPSGQVFDEWVGDTSGIADVNDPTTTLTMPAAAQEITATYGAATLYTLTVNSGSGDGSYQEGWEVSISADAPASGKVFDEWIGDTSGIANVNASSTTLTMPAANAEVTATYVTATTYALTVNSGTGDGNYTQGTIVDITADSPPSGKQFDEWVGDTSSMANVGASSTTITMPAAAQEITATYEDAGSGSTQLIVDWGSSSGNNIFDFSDWESVYLGQYTGYTSDGPDGLAGGWTGTGLSGRVSGSSESFSEGDQIKVTWYNGHASSSYTFTPKISFDDPDKYGSGTAGTWYDMTQLNCAAQSSGTTTYTFTSGTAGSYSLVNVTRYTNDGEEMVIDKYELVIPGGPTTYTLTVNSGSGDGDYAEDTVVSISADAAPSGQDFDEWTGDTANIASVTSSSTTLTMPAAAQEITATYTDKTWTLTVNSGTGDGSYVVATVVDIDADTAPSGQDFAAWTGDTTGIASLTSASTTITMPYGNAEITATYTDKTWTLTVDSGTGDGSYVVDTVVDIDADAAPSGQDFDEWVGDTSGVANVNAASTTLTMPYAAAEVTATYTDKTWTLTIYKGAGDGSYVVGTAVDIDADAAPSGQEFDEWTGDTDGIASLTSASTTITMPYANATITATYADKTWTLTVNSGTGDGDYVVGTVVDITADTAPSGQEFDQWVGDTEGIAELSTAATTLTMPYADAEITATYADIVASYTLTVNSGTGDGDYSATTVVDITADAAASGRFFDTWAGDNANIADVNDPSTTITMPAADAEVTATYTYVASGLVSRYTFDMDARDTYGANDGTFANGASVTSDDTRGNVATLDGTDDYVDLPEDEMAAGRSEVTLSMWIYPDEWDSTNTIYDEDQNNWWQFSIREDNWYTRDTSTGTTGSRDNDLTMPTVTAGQWSHLAFVYSVTDDLKAIYHNGSLSASTNTSIDTLTSNRTAVRIGWPGDGTYYDGLMDDVRLYSRALNTTEIALLAGQSVYTLTVNSGTGDGDYPEDEVVDIAADAASSGQDFDEWVGDTSGIASLTSSSTTLTMPAGNQEITATYTDKTWTLTVNSGTGDGSYVVATVVDIDAEAAPSGQEFDEWIGDTEGMAGLTSASTTLTMPYADAQITATYTDKTWTLTVNSGTGDGSYVVGTIVDITADTAPSGQEFDDWIGDTAGIADLNDPTTTISMAYADAEITATYEDIPSTYTLTVNSGSGDGSYASSTVVDVDADTAPSGQQFDEWVGDTEGIASLTSASTTMTMPASNAEITATYTDITTGTIHFREGGGTGYTDVTFDDTYIKSYPATDDTYGNLSYDGIYARDDASYERVSLIAVKDMFTELPPTTGGKDIVITSAILYLYRYQGSSSTTVYVNRVTTDWLADPAGSNENDVSGEHAEKSQSTDWASGDFSTSDYDTSTTESQSWSDTYNGEVAIDVTDVIDDIYDAGNNYGMVVRSSGASIYARASEYGTSSYRPSLEIAYYYSE